MFVLIMFVRDTSDRQTVTHKRGLSVYCKLMSRLHKPKTDGGSLSPRPRGPATRQPNLAPQPGTDLAPTRHRPGNPAVPGAVPGNPATRHRPSAA